jgi:hypothetical protein
VDAESLSRKPRLAELARRWFKVPALDLNRRVSPYNLVGLPVLYASGYFLPPIEPTGAYFLPSRDYLSLIVVPTLLAVGVGMGLIYVLAVTARRWCPPRLATLGAVALLSMLALVSLKGVFDSAGYSWQDRLPRFHSLASSQYFYKILACCVIVLLVWTLRGSLNKLTRLLSSIGFAFIGLAVIHLSSIWNQPNAGLAGQLSGGSAPMGFGASNYSLAGGTPSAGGASMPAGVRSRRVVWVIFDETDFDRAFGAQKSAGLELPNFDRLARTSVFAMNANSPASATLYSIPALLTGEPIAGDGIRISSGGSLYLSRMGRRLPFDQETSIFGALAASGRDSSVLGFFHPYCKLFSLSRCDSFPFPEIGGPAAAIWANIPDSIKFALEGEPYWASITRRSLELLPQYLARDDALTFVHLNFPHLPATYADHRAHLAASSNPLDEYARNLSFTDRILGEIVSDLQQQASRHDLLLVLSTDHWLRNRWYRASAPEVSRPVPLIVWKVGDVNGYVLSQPISTVNTAEMILRYLDGNLSTEADIAEWWKRQPIYPSFVAPNT